MKEPKASIRHFRGTMKEVMTFVRFVRRSLAMEIEFAGCTAGTCSIQIVSCSISRVMYRPAEPAVVRIARAKALLQPLGHSLDQKIVGMVSRLIISHQDRRDTLLIRLQISIRFRPLGDHDSRLSTLSLSTERVQVRVPLFLRRIRYHLRIHLMSFGTMSPRVVEAVTRKPSLRRRLVTQLITLRLDCPMVDLRCLSTRAVLATCAVTSGPGRSLRPLCLTATKPTIRSGIVL